MEGVPMAIRQEQRTETEIQVVAMLERVRWGNQYTRKLIEHSKEQIRLSLELLGNQPHREE
jgi:hypothetical protein